jgi:hypothetical protein
MAQMNIQLTAAVLLGCGALITALWSHRRGPPQLEKIIPPRETGAFPNNEADPRATAPERPALQVAPSPLSFSEEAAKLNLLPLDEGVRAKALRELVERWMPYDPLACMAFLETGRFEPLRRSLTHHALELWLTADHFTASAYAEAKIFENDQNCAFYLDPLLQAMLPREDGASAVLSYIEKLPRTEAVYGAAVPAFCACAGRDLAAAVAFAHRAPPRMKSSLLEIVGAENARQIGTSLLAELDRADAATKWSQQEIAGIAATLINSAPEETLRWLDGQPVSATFDHARAKVSQTLAMKDQTEAALRVAAMITDPRLRDDLTERFLRQLSSRDLSVAEAWAVASDLSPDTVAQILADAQTPPVPFEQRMSGILPTGDTKALRRSQSAVFMQWIHADPDAAARWLEQSDFSPDEKKSWASILPRSPKE